MAILSFVIPAYNEADNLSDTIAELLQALAAASETLKDVEIIVVDDHSQDHTLAAVAAMNDTRIYGIRLSRRSGSHVALRAGLALARGQAVCCLSADGQDDPAAVPEMLQVWRNGAHIVWALRHQRKQEPLKVKLFAALFYRMLAFLNPEQTRNIDLARADFYLLDRKVVDAIRQTPERNTSLFGMIAAMGFRQEAVTYNRRERRFGNSKWSFRSRLRLAMDWMVSFSGIPLKLMMLLGFAVSCLGFTYALVVIFMALRYGAPVTGWPMVVTLILILGGVQLITLGVMGEYLWRTFDETKQRPLYFIEATTGNEPNRGENGCDGS